MANKNINERNEMISAMDTIMRSMNDEEIFMTWITFGVADGDVNHEEIQKSISETESDFSYYEDDDNFAELMDTFLHCVAIAMGKRIPKEKRKAVLFCDGVISKSEMMDDFC